MIAFDLCGRTGRRIDFPEDFGWLVEDFVNSSALEKYIQKIYHDLEVEDSTIDTNGLRSKRGLRQRVLFSFLFLHGIRESSSAPSAERASAHLRAVLASLERTQSSPVNFHYKLRSLS